LHLEHIKEFIELHFQKAYEIAFNVGLKNPKDEKLYKAFIMKTLNGLRVQIAEGNKQILELLNEIENNAQSYLQGGQAYLEKEWKDKDDKFKKDVLDYL
jgi:hypothetical protein